MWWPVQEQVGSVGAFTWYPPTAGTYKGLYTSSMDSSQLFAMLDTTNSAFNSYNALKATYDTAKNTYNTAVAAEKLRVQDLYK